MISQKYLAIILSGVGVIGSSLSILQLNKENKHTKPNSTTPKNLEKSSGNKNIKEKEPLWENSEVKKTCGKDVWGGQSGWNPNDTNEKGFNWDSYSSCLARHLMTKK